MHFGRRPPRRSGCSAPLRRSCLLCTSLPAPLPRAVPENDAPGLRRTPPAHLAPSSLHSLALSPNSPLAKPFLLRNRRAPPRSLTAVFEKFSPSSSPDWARYAIPPFAGHSARRCYWLTRRFERCSPVPVRARALQGMIGLDGRREEPPINRLPISLGCVDPRPSACFLLSPQLSPHLSALSLLPALDLVLHPLPSISTPLRNRFPLPQTRRNSRFDTRLVLYQLSRVREGDGPAPRVRSDPGGDRRRGRGWECWKGRVHQESA
ncbi:hypothetical protein AAT19DRAFT_15045 [Rhodotorula toruloides]|uniref:Uncharacterized protein n=1 Tax=Rhodotorula toruloides TaxID=5286 RepID=A0A2T0A9M6_RHOTO|nr:hypothetical protein AAT19DRAFT_15045 [Rhodotorula toruloides]